PGVPGPRVGRPAGDLRPVPLRVRAAMRVTEETADRLVIEMPPRVGYWFSASGFAAGTVMIAATLLAGGGPGGARRRLRRGGRGGGRAHLGRGGRGPGDPHGDARPADEHRPGRAARVVVGVGRGTAAHRSRGGRVGDDTRFRRGDALPGRPPAGGRSDAAV